MSDLEIQDRKEGLPAPELLRPIFSPWLTILAMATQTTLCGLTWGFVGLTMVKTLPLRDSSARWINSHSNDTNMIIIVISTVLGLIGSSLLCITVEHALLFRLSRGVPLSLVAPWVQIARNSLFLQSRRHLWWTLLSVVWLVVTRLLITAWSNLLTPVTVVRNFPVSGVDLDFLSTAFADDIISSVGVPYALPGANNFSLTPESLGFLAGITGYLSQGGRSAISDYLEPGYPSFVGRFNSSTGGVNPTSAQYQLSSIPTLPENYQGLSTSFSLVQQGYTANISCMTSASPTITLNNSASVEHTFQAPLGGPFNYSLETWSWSTNCSGSRDFYTGEVNLLTSSNGPIGGGLFAVSVCYYQNFSGPSNQSFLVLLQSPTNTTYSSTYFAADPNLPIVCQVTPMITAVEAQYNQSGLNNVNTVLEQVLLPDASWVLGSLQASVIWAAYFFAQGLYSNAFADDLIEVVQLLDSTGFNGDFTPILGQYLRGIFEYMGSVIRASVISQFISAGRPIPGNMSIPITGTMNVQTIGWQFHAQTHSIAIAIIMLVAAATLAFGILALVEAGPDMILRSPQMGGVRAFHPTNLVDFILASSMGNLTDKLSECKSDEERERLRVGLSVTDGGQCVLDVR